MDTRRKLLLVVIFVALAVLVFSTRPAQVSSPVIDIKKAKVAADAAPPEWLAGKSLLKLRSDIPVLLSLYPKNWITLRDMADGLLAKVRATKYWKAKNLDVLLDPPSQSTSAQGEQLQLEHLTTLAKIRTLLYDDLESVEEVLIAVGAASPAADKVPAIMMLARFNTDKFPTLLNETLSSSLAGAASADLHETRVEQLGPGNYRVTKINKGESPLDQAVILLHSADKEITALINAANTEEFFSAQAGEFQASPLGKVLLASVSSPAMAIYALDYQWIFKALEISSEAAAKNETSPHPQASFKEAFKSIPFRDDIKNIAGSFTLGQGLRAFQCLSVKDGSQLHSMYKTLTASLKQAAGKDAVLSSLLSERSFLGIELPSAAFASMAEYYRQAFKDQVAAVSADPDYKAALDRVLTVEEFFRKQSFSKINLLVNAASVGFTPEVTIILSDGSGAGSIFLKELEKSFKDILSEWQVTLSLTSTPDGKDALTIDLAGRFTVHAASIDENTVAFSSAQAALSEIPALLKQPSEFSKRLKVYGASLAQALQGSEVSIFLSSKSVLVALRPWAGLFLAQVPEFAGDPTMIDELQKLLEFNFVSVQRSDWIGNEALCTESAGFLASE